jgi:NADH:ubiquinone oxidoreductase subunit F (NADH-binding)/(2Fe-2S) ferredoxin
MTFKEIQSVATTEWKALKESDETLIHVGTSTCGRAVGAKKVLDHIQGELEHRNIEAQVMEVGCIGLCGFEPLVTIAKPGKPPIFYNNVTGETASQIISDYVVNDNPRPDLALCVMDDKGIEGITALSELPMLKSQTRIAIRNCGHIDPRNINQYIAKKGYSGLAKALGMTPEEVIEEVSKSGLRGRGGAGFPTSDKLRSCHDAPGREKFVICNASEGDPGSFTARALLESDPHAVLEGMLIVAYAVGSGHGIIYINPEYSLALKILETALKQMEDCGLLGKSIMDSDFSFRIEVRPGGGTFVCGEETSLLNSLEGKRGMTFARPPYPETSGLQGKPTAINNIETFAHLSAIMLNGPESYSAYGSEKSKGTKLFTLAGNVMNPGLIEVPMGTTLRSIIFDIGGGIPDSKDFKAVQTGGPTGGWLSAEFLDTPSDYEDLIAAGSIMGSGSLIVADNTACAVDLARQCLSFIETESCGKCVFGREGTMQLAEILTDLTEGRGKSKDIELLVDLGEAMKIGAFCSFGKTSPNPVLTTIRDFRDEYQMHARDKQCAANVCKKIVK